LGFGLQDETQETVHRQSGETNVGTPLKAKESA